MTCSSSRGWHVTRCTVSRSTWPPSLSRWSPTSGRDTPEHSVEFGVAGKLPGEGDAPLLRVLLVNLLGNAWKFTRDTASPHVEIGQTSVAGEPVYYVRDNGAGFDMAYADKLFAPFQRLHRADEFEGTGIGLATVQRIVRRHGGTTRGEGAPGKGAVFFFTLGPHKEDT